jgi:hypothetical protein
LKVTQKRKKDGLPLYIWGVNAGAFLCFVDILVKKYLGAGALV